MPITWPTGTVMPSVMTMRRRRPEAKDSTSTVALSVSHFDYGFTSVDVIALGLEPADDGAFLHVEAHLGHYHVGGQGSASFELATSTAK